MKLTIENGLRRASLGNVLGRICGPAGRKAALLAFAVLLAGCGTRHYRKSADKDVYRIIDQVETQIFKRTNAFTIDTPYSARDPKTILPGEIIEDRLATNRRVINLRETLDLAVRTSREYQNQKEQLYLRALALTGQRHRFTPNFFGSINPSWSGDGNGNVDLDALKPEAGFSQAFKSGGSLSVKLVNDLMRYYTGDPGTAALSVMSVDIAQPLLQGFGRNSDAVEALTQAQRSVIYSIRSFDQYQRQFAVDIVNDYFSLLGQKDSVRNNYTNYLRRVETRRYTEARAVDRVRQSEVDDARTQELNARIMYVNSVAQYMSQIDAFKVTLGLPLKEDLYLDDGDLRELSTAGLGAVPIDRDAGFRIAVSKHADILNAIDSFEDAKRQVRLAADKLKPGIRFQGSASYAVQDSTNSWSYHYARFNPDQFRYNFGLQIDLPLDRLAQRNDYRGTLVDFERELRQLGLTLDTFKERIDRGLRTLEQRRLNYISQLDALEVARRRVENDTLLLEAGRTDVQKLRQSQDALIQSQNDLVFTMVDHLQARLQVLLDLGLMTTDHPSFWLQDPLAGKLDDSQRGPPPLQMPDDNPIPPDQFLEPSS